MLEHLLGDYGAVLPLILPDLLGGVLATLRLAGLAFALALVVGLALALAKLSDNRVLRTSANIYIEIIRGTPALVQLFLVYYGLLSIGVKFNAFEAAVIGLGFNVGAYVAEIFRAGILAVDVGQREACYAIGMTRMKAMRYVVLPQAVRMVLPPLATTGISLLKDTSIAALISVPDLLLRARDLTSEYFMPLEIFITVGIIYFLICFPLSLMVRAMEWKWHPETH